MSNPEKTDNSTIGDSKKTEEPQVSDASKTQPSRIYLKAMPLRSLSDLETIKNEVKSGSIVILKFTPLAEKSVEDIKKAINELYDFVKTIDGDIARLGEERIVVTPPGVQIWRGKNVAREEQVPTAT